MSFTSDSAPPLFMFGFERSGTTLLSMMVGAHPDIAVPLTVTGLWYRYAERLVAYHDLATPEDLERLVTDLLAEERIQLWDTKLSANEVLEDLVPESYASVVERFHCLYARHKGKRLWGNLDIATLDEMDIANRWFPKARFLHIVRDGRDVALSHETMPYGTSNTLECAEHWVQRLRTNLKMGAILGPERYQVIRYEDLILDSETTLERICQFIDVKYSPTMLEYPAMVDGKVPKHRRWLWPELDKAPVKSKVYGWKTRMSRTKRVVFEGIANRMLLELGYEAFASVPKRASAYAYELWCFLGRAGRFKRLTKKLGIARESSLERNWRKTWGQKTETSYSQLQQTSFGALVKQGVYDVDFEHSEQAKAFFRDCMARAFAEADSQNGMAVLDAGCGPGAWLEFLYAMQAEKSDSGDNGVEYFGFDLTLEMARLARQRLSARIPHDHLCEGDVLMDASYAFGQEDRRFQIIYAYDVIQQLPRKFQWQACTTLLGRLAPGGVAVIFDHDSDSPYGRKMAVKKFITRYLGIGLVPRYYCNARYPSLSRFAREIAASGNFSTKIWVAPDGRKRALIACFSVTRPT